jgi:hypothetical protein
VTGYGLSRSVAWTVTGLAIWSLAGLGFWYGLRRLLGCR